LFCGGWGDSTDGTEAQLLRWGRDDPRVTVLKCDTGKPRYGSVVHPERFEVLAAVFNTLVDHVANDGWSDYSLFVPSDVVFEPNLLADLLAKDKDIISPFFWVNNGGDWRFYDIWGFIKDGQQFQPYNRAWYMARYSEPIEMDAVGGAMLVKKAVWLAGVRYTRENVDRGLCQTAKSLGFGVWADPLTNIAQVYDGD
jgi:hypothetical protein